MLKILVPDKTGVNGIAASEFASLWQKVTGEKLSIVTRDDPKSDLIVLGSDAVNAFSHAKIVEKVIPQFSVMSGSDAYQFRSAKDKNGRKLLFIAGGRPRALLYGVYRFFELRANCRYFWDGDIIPEAKTIDITGLDLIESPRFRYRGLRYFAHRSLTRFQAEHWDFPEWKKEIDWILKKRMNLFMLRIGIDDLFQKAFPDVVPYPKGYEVSASTPRSYDDHTLFWSLKYRGELRKKVLAYARERDLLHPEDVGTMTHWYSRTPQEYLDKVKPDFIPQTTSGYNQPSGLVWDIRQDKNLEAYWKLTETHIREYGSPEIFHTIGLAERRCYEDRASNHQMKLYTYRRIQKILREHYPNAPLLIGSWDFCMYWQPEEVRELVKELDPERTLIFDYTSDTDDELRTFQNWDLCGKFPWIYGIFHAFEPNTEPRGNYEAIARRLPVAAEDPMCKGMVFWPENSHSDTLMLEFLAANAWDPEKSNVRIASFLEKFCAARYDAPTCRKMLPLWKEGLKFIEARHWNGPGIRKGGFSGFQFSEFAFLPAVQLDHNPVYPGRAQYLHQTVAEAMPAAPALLRRFAALKLEREHEFVRRDVLDLTRAIAGRLFTYAFTGLMVAVQKWHAGDAPASEVDGLFVRIAELERIVADILASSSEYSLYASLQELKAKQKTNPDFEFTLKGNAENNYCRSYITELFEGVYLPELEVCRKCFADVAKAGKREWKFADDPRLAKVRDKFYATPLRKLAPDCAAAAKRLPANLKKLADRIDALLSTLK
ncbi:MAG: hypothetical protein IJS14_07885 [Lentisphaeria bacterium]|nr:hypothetical protein [Lentisphaeria bacterium]